jgi:hypothetical protein
MWRRLRFDKRLLSIYTINHPWSEQFVHLKFINRGSFGSGLANQEWPNQSYNKTPKRWVAKISARGQTEINFLDVILKSTKLTILIFCKAIGFTFDGYGRSREPRNSPVFIGISAESNDLAIMWKLLLYLWNACHLNPSYGHFGHHVIVKQCKRNNETITLLPPRNLTGGWLSFCGIRITSSQLDGWPN